MYIKKNKNRETFSAKYGKMLKKIFLKKRVKFTWAVFVTRHKFNKSIQVIDDFMFGA